MDGCAFSSTSSERTFAYVGAPQYVEYASPPPSPYAPGVAGTLDACQIAPAIRGTDFFVVSPLAAGIECPRQ